MKVGFRKLSLLQKVGPGGFTNKGETEAEVCHIQSTVIASCVKVSCFHTIAQVVQLPGAIPRSQLFYCYSCLVENSCRHFFGMFFGMYANVSPQKNLLSWLPLVVIKDRKLVWKSKLKGCLFLYVTLWLPEEKHFCMGNCWFSKREKERKSQETNNLRHSQKHLCLIKPYVEYIWGGILFS